MEGSAPCRSFWGVLDVLSVSLILTLAHHSFLDSRYSISFSHSLVAPTPHSRPSPIMQELYSVEAFTVEMDSLLEITLRSRLIEKISLALYDVLFDEESNSTRAPSPTKKAMSAGSGGDDQDPSLPRLLDEEDHLAIASVLTFIQNLYFYAGRRSDELRQHLLSDTLLIPRLILPYLDRCIVHANLLEKRARQFSQALSSSSSAEESKDSRGRAVDGVSQLALDDSALVKGISASLRVLTIASFRAPPTRFVLDLMCRLNPTSSLLRAPAFISRHDYLLSLLCLLNVNMNALDLSQAAANQDGYEGYGSGWGGSSEGYGGGGAVNALSLLHDVASIYTSLDAETQIRVFKRIVSSGALPVARDTPSYVAVMSVLHGGAAETQLDYIRGAGKGGDGEGDAEGPGGEESWDDARAEAKREARQRLDTLKPVQPAPAALVAAAVEAARVSVRK